MLSEVTLRGDNCLSQHFTQQHTAQQHISMNNRELIHLRMAAPARDGLFGGVGDTSGPSDEITVIYRGYGNLIR
jgi:hypothetical protein